MKNYNSLPKTYPKQFENYIKFHRRIQFTYCCFIPVAITGPFLLFISNARQNTKGTISRVYLQRIIPKSRMAKYKIFQFRPLLLCFGFYCHEKENNENFLKKWNLNLKYQKQSIANLFINLPVKCIRSITGFTLK